MKLCQMGSSDGTEVTKHVMDTHVREHNAHSALRLRKNREHSSPTAMAAKLSPEQYMSVFL
jgi:hypothetical protein